MTRHTPTTERTTLVAREVPARMTQRARPRWARIVRHLGEDLSWAMNGWSDFPRSTRRAVAGVAGATAGWLMGFQDVGSRLAEVIGG